MKKHVDVLIIGAGPGGSIAATVLNKAGLKICVVEKSSFPRFVIGESLLPMCMNVLDDCGLIETVKKNGFQEKVGARFINNNSTADFNFSYQFTPGWSWTWQVTRSNFDQILINSVIEKGVDVYFNSNVEEVSIDDNGKSTTYVTQKDGKSFSVDADYIIDASGYGRVLTKKLNLDKPSKLPSRNAVFAHVEDSKRKYFDDSNRIVIVDYAPEVWAWVIPFSNGNTSFGFVGNKAIFNSSGKDSSSIIKSLVAKSDYLQNRFGNISFVFPPNSLEGWSASSTSYHGKGFVLVGNGAEFLDPIFSSGVMFSLVSSQLASQLVIKKLNGINIDFEKEYSDFLKVGINTFTAFINAWYNGSLKEIFFYPERNELIHKQITSILAGYVWDVQNPFVVTPERSIERVYNSIRAK